ncbi:MAG TPA: beta-propeller fold lactonase family protein [Solirubrobacterales bacterium]|nr:beta-propeller fold lactonase family protein [Solirubrobacterales bacterium]
MTGSLIAVFVSGASENAEAAATYSPAGPVSPAVDMPRSVSFSSSGEFLAAAGASGPLSRYAIRHGGALEPLAPSNMCAGSSVAFKPTGSVLASVDSAASTVSLCTVSRTDGSITPLGSPMPTETTPTTVQFSPDGKFLATTNVDDPSISMFTVGATTLAPVNDGEAFYVEFGGGSITSATFSPDSHFLLVTSGCPIGPTLTVYAVAADGFLNKVDAVNLPGFECAVDTKFVGTTDKFIVVADDWLGSSGTNLVSYTLGPTGEVTGAAGTIPAGPGPVDVAVDPTGKLIAYTNYQEDTLTLLRRAEDGALKTVMSVSPGDGPSSVAFSADGAMVSVTTANDDSVELYHLAPGPALLPAGAPTPLEGIASFMAVSSTGRVAVTTQGLDGVELFTLSAAGRLARTARLGPAEVDTPHGVAFSSNGNLLAVASDDGLSTYTVSAAGVPTHADSATAADVPYRVAFSPDGSLLATASYWDDLVSLFSVTPGGVLTPRGSLPANGPRSLAFSPDGSLLATANELGGDVGLFDVSGATLTAKPPIATGGNPGGIAFRPTGSQLAVVNYASDKLTTYAIDANGQATQLDSEHVQTPVWVAYSPSGDMLAAVDETDDASDPSELWTFSVSAAGTMKQFGDPTVVDLNPYGVAFDATGRFILIPQILDRDLWVYPLEAPVLDTVIGTGPPAYDSRSSSTFDFDASYPSTYECKFDSGSFAACDRAAAIQVANDGPHTLAVRARDAVGNVDPTPATYSWTRDATPPSAPAPSIPLDGAANLAPTTSFSWQPSADALSGVSSYELIVDGAPSATVQPPACAAICTSNVPGLANGAHTWSVRATDVAGNASQSPVRTFSVDAEPPGLPSLLAPTGAAAVGSARPTLSWVATTDPGSGIDHYEISVDGQTLPSTTATSIQVPIALADGNHTWSLVAVDRAGNRSSPASATFRTDTTAPIARLAAGPRQTLPGISVVLDAGGSADPFGAIADYSWDTNGDGVLDRDTGTNALTTTTFTTVGTYHLTVQVTDQAGLTSSASADVTIKAGLSGALGQGAGVRFIPPKATGSRLVKLILTPPDGARAARISNDDDPNQPGIKRVVFERQEPITTDWLLDPQTSPGKETKQVFVWFERGTELVHTSPTIVLDEEAPQLSMATFSLSRTRTGKPTALVRIKAGDGRGTGIAKMRVSSKCSGAFKPIKTRPRNGTYTIRVNRPKSKLRVTVRDAVGNTSRCVTAKKRD